jgi:YHS domain-containing protein
MIRALLYAILIMVLYHAIKTVFRSAVSSYGEGNELRPRSGRLPGGEMVLDPQCRTYVVKERAVTRRIKGSTTYFCSNACADEYTRSLHS